ncbi:CHAT domain-containing protein [Pedococcus dokdonensis]|uniref:CHAT domain-containing protein n=1 Tax=Pedococcus dokdonensis TaxID=443156 RepID=A0A1H0PEI0_9MICO|nr:CHAT domain-containing protein [Pedococcus dokdonensis]SDP03058.1 CHAT domain-containing protein [Pedococcus dokdonensis]
MTTSLLREELLDVPPALTGNPAFDGPLTALLHGEPRRALDLLQGAPPGRTTAALTAWARQLDRNWYPGDVGAEVGLDPDGAFVQPRPTQDPVEGGTEMLTAYGPNGLRTPRTLVELSMRMGAMPGVQQAVGQGDQYLGWLSQYAQATGQPALVQWTFLAGADLHRRAGDPGHAALLEGARQQAQSLGDSPRLALTFLAEGDWAAAPGSSPEALGWDLAPQNVPSPLGVSDLPRAAAAWDQAEQLLQGFDLPRFRSALALRRAVLARASGDVPAKRARLAAALGEAARSGDSAAYHLAAVHTLVADIDEGLLGQHQLDLGGGWHPPTHGPVADLLSWADTVGSRSWCVGLGRLLQRCGDAWQQAGSAARARVAYLAAVQLVSTDSAVPSDTLHTAIAQVEARLNLSANALLRLERAFADRFADTDATDDFGFAQKLEASLVMVQAYRARARGAAAGLTADRMQTLRDGLAAAHAAMSTKLGPADGPVPRDMEGLQAAIAAMRQDGSLEDSAAVSERAVQLMVRVQLEMARSQLDMIDVIVALARATASEQAGLTGEAQRWFEEAVTRAKRPQVEPYLLPLALYQANRRDEAAAALRTTAAGLADDLLLSMWVRVGEVDAAQACLDRLRAAGRSLDDWVSLLTVAELRLAQGDAAAARDSARAGMVAFEGLVSGVLRDPDRLDACDQPDVVALYATVALAEQRLGHDEAAFDAAESVRRLVAGAGSTAPHDPVRAAWQRAAAEYSAVSKTVLAVVGSRETTDLFTGLDEADGRLMAAEQALESAQPGSLLRGVVSAPPAGIAALRSNLPVGTVVLAYLTVGDDFLAWAVTRDELVPHHRTLRERDVAELVRRVHAGCADGRAPAETAQLAELVLGPFTAQLHGNQRVVVVPFGSLNLVPFHALPFSGAALGESHVVSYAASAPAAVTAAGAQGVTARRPLVVGDPAFDRTARPQLAQLPGSRVEAVAVAAALRAADPLLGEAATEPAVAARLEDCDLLHLSSHGHVDELSPFASALVMAGTDELTVAELVGLRFRTDLAVLTGCDTGRGTATLGGDVIGLTRALLQGGVQRAVVSLWPVDDAVAPVTMNAFYQHLMAGSPPAEALAEAQRAVRAMDADALQAAYVELGGGGPATGTRRGVELDPELRDDDELPAPLGGDAERYWAPFVLVG